MSHKLTWVALVALTLPANAQTVAYVCVEERSVGWETKSNGQMTLGRFKPSENKIIVKWSPEIWLSSGDTGEKYLRVPKIEVSEGGETFKYESNTCDIIYRNTPMFKDLSGREKFDAHCHNLLNRPHGDDYYGSGGIMYVFEKRLRDEPASTTYLSVITASYTQRAYMSAGSCAKID
jgi:hypothetical protein